MASNDPFVDKQIDTEFFSKQIICQQYVQQE